MTEKERKDKEFQENLKKSGVIPNHVAIIMDGNGRWAKEKGYTRFSGHREGVNSVREIVEVSGELGIKYLTLYTFSTENWRRPKAEVTLLMKLLIQSLRDETDRLHKNDVKLISTGDLHSLPDKVHKELLDAMEKTKNNKLMTLNLALSYSGRWEIVNAVKNIIKDYDNSKIKPEEIDEALFSNYLTTAGIPDPDLLIRTGGDLRISNFMLWQAAYSEIYIDEHYWPDFKRDLFYKSIIDFQKRERRFGMVSEQVQNKDSVQN